MILTEEDRIFLKANRRVLESLFNRRIEELKEKVFSMRAEDRDLEIRFINEYKSWLILIKIVSEEEKKKRETFV